MLYLFSDIRGVIVENYSLYNTNAPSLCQNPPICNDGHTSVELIISNLTRAYGNVTITVFPFADFSDNTGPFYGYYEIYIGGQRISSLVPGVVSGAPVDGMFRKLNGIRPSICCYTEGNAAVIVVKSEFFNNSLGIDAKVNQLQIIINIPADSTTRCAADNNSCRNIDNGEQVARVEWEPVSWGTFSDCLIGPNTNVSPVCDVYDIDIDNDIDLRDVAYFLNIDLQ